MMKIKLFLQDSSPNATLTTLSQDNLQPFLCLNGTYNDMATLFFNDQETAIKQLFHRSGA